MKRYLIQVTHSNDHRECVLALAATERNGGHFATNVDWGCKTGVHSGWLVVDVDSRVQAMQMIPSEFREDEVTIVELSKFTREEILSWVAKLGEEDK